jgi:hypothetical protein
MIWTPEGQADSLEQARSDPGKLRELTEGLVGSALGRAAHSARAGAVLLRRIRDRRLYEPAGWPTWKAFAEFWSPGGEERFELLISALEVLDARGEHRDFPESEAPGLAKLRDHGGDRRSDEAKAVQPANGSLKYGSHSAPHIRKRLERDAKKGAAKEPLFRTPGERLALDLLPQLEAGEISAHKAARQMGWIKDPTPLAQMRSAWKRASPEQQATFRREIAPEGREGA